MESGSFRVADPFLYQHEFQKDHGDMAVLRRDLQRQLHQLLYTDP